MNRPVQFFKPCTLPQKKTKSKFRHIVPMLAALAVPASSYAQNNAGPANKDVFIPQTEQVTPAHKQIACIIDDFHTKNVDIDGDGIPDLSHGEVVSRYAIAQNPDLQVLQFDVKEVSVESVLAAFQQAQQNGHCDAVASSVSFDLPIQNLDGATPDNISDKKLGLLGMLDKSKNPKEQQLYELLSILSDFSEDRIAVYLAGGNSGPDTLNLNTLAIRTYNVGATDQKGEHEPYSANNSLINRWAQGTYAVRKLPGGYDISGHGKPDVLDSEVSGGTPLIGQFMGKPAQQFLATQADQDALDSAQLGHPQNKESPFEFTRGKVFPTSSLYNGIGEYVIYSPFNGTPVAFLTTDQKGNLTVNPAKFGAPDTVVKEILGTSVAQPTELGMDSLQGLKPPSLTGSN
jgi:hypothetical protein